MPRPLRLQAPDEPIDERDTLFSRARLAPGLPVTEAHYARRPDQREADDRTRALPGLACPGGARHRPVEGALIHAIFETSDLIAEAVWRKEAQDAGSGRASGLGPGEARATSREAPDLSPAALSRTIKDIARFLGANDVGITDLPEGLIYSHRGRPLERHGEPITLPHRHAIVMAFDMRLDFVGAGPELVTTAESARVYQEASAASFALAGTLERLGIPARAHVDSNYLVLAPPLAERAGLGEVGRNTFLIHRTLGPGVRLGVVTVASDLVNDSPEDHGIRAFCQVCAKCATNCPSRAIPEGEPVTSRGVSKWVLSAEKCYHYWRTQGSDCGICIRVCPFAKPDSPLHRMVRWMIREWPVFNRLLHAADDLVYGRRPALRPPPLLGISPRN